MLGFSRRQGRRLSAAEERPLWARLKRPPLPVEATCPLLEVQAAVEASTFNSREDSPRPLPSRRSQAQDENEDVTVMQPDYSMYH
jgi:hypothetical protein